MSLAEARRAQSVHAAILLLCSIPCVVLAIGADVVARSNQLRREQVRRLAEVLGKPEQVAEGPIVGLEGMFGSTIRRVTTPVGPVIVFGSDARGGRT